MNKKMLMTSGYNFEGYTITEYLGVFSGECALGTGFLSSLGAGISDFLGTNSKMYSNKLKEAKEELIACTTDLEVVSSWDDNFEIICVGSASKSNY